jgi:hypothetical protein
VAEVTREALRLLVIPDRRVMLSTTGVALRATSEAGPRPGPVVAEQTTPAVFTASGTLDEDLDDIHVSVSRSGGPGSAEVRWRHDGESSRSYDPPSAISEWEFIDRSTTAGKWSRPHAARLASGLVVLVATDASYSATCWRQSASGLWSSATVHTGTTETVATVCVLPSGRLLCHYLVGTSTTTQIRMAYSDDGGATWTTGSTNCLATPIAEVSSDFTRIRSYVLGQDVGLVLWGGPGAAEVLNQYASSDLGATFDLIESIDGTIKRTPDVSVRGGIAYVVYLEMETALEADPNRWVPHVRRLGSARRPISGADATTFEDNVAWDNFGTPFGELAIVADDDGTLWIYGRDGDGAGTNEVMCACSTDGGLTWAKPFQGSSNGAGLTIAAWGVAASYVYDFCAVAERGRIVLIHRSVAAVANGDDSLCAAYLGGWSTVAMPRDTDYPRMADTGGWDTVWLPIEKPADIGWTRTVAGTPTQVLGSAGLVTTMAGGESQVYSVVPPWAGPKAGILWTGQVQVTSGTHTVDLKISDGANGYAIRLEVTPTTIWLYDVHLGAYIGIVTSETVQQNGVSLLVCLDAPSGYGVAQGRVRAYYRGTGNTTLSGPKADRQWSSITGLNTLTRAALVAPYVGWGASVAGVGVATWRWVGYSSSTYVAGGDGLTDPSRGRQVPDRTSPVHVEKGLRLGMVSGPALVGQTWLHSTSHDYPVEAVDVSTAASPSRCHRSTDDATQQDIVWTVDGGWRAGDLVALWIGGANWRTAALYRGAGAATKVMDVDLGLTGLDFVRTRDLLYSAQSGTALPWAVREGALDGATFALSAGVRRRVRHARGGWWPATAGTFPLAELELSGYDAGDPASGTGELWMPNGLFLTTLMQSTDTLTLQLDAQTTADGYHQTGIAMLGRVAALGLQHGWGRAVEVKTSVELTEMRGGARRARQLAANRPAYEIGWSEGADQNGLYSAASPRYVSMYTGGPAHGDIPSTLPTIAGLLGELGGSKTPGVLCFRVPTQASAPTAAAPIRVIDPAMLVYGRITTETWRNDNVLGEEGTDPGEVMRGGVLRIEGEL